MYKCYICQCSLSIRKGRNSRILGCFNMVIHIQGSMANYHVSGFLVSFNRKLSPKANVEFKLTHLIGFRDLTDLDVSMLYTVVLLMYNFLDFLSLCICVQILCFFYEPKQVDISIYIIFFSWSFYWLTELQFGPGFQFWGPLLWVLPQDLLMPRLGIPRLLFQCEYMILLYEWLLDQNPPADFCF